MFHIATGTISFGTAKTNLYAVTAYITNTCTPPSSSSFVSLSNLFYPHLSLHLDMGLETGLSQLFAAALPDILCEILVPFLNEILVDSVRSIVLSEWKFRFVIL